VIDREGKTPVYQQIAAILRDRITTGQILPGRPVPSEPQLAGEFLVEVVTGRGAYVRE
jgi:DNA-binding transcriptional regulator YhcF (GntR family)